MAQVWEVTAVGGTSEGLVRTLEEAGARIEGKGEGREVVRFAVRGDLEPHRPALLERARREGYDLAVVRASEGPREWKLAVFDMDSTVISIEVIDELARASGRYEEVAKITARAMRGELDFEQSLRARVALLAGTPVEVLDRIAENLPLNEGAERLMRGLRKMGVRVAVLSGGFAPAAEALQARLELDHVHANHLEAREGKFTGGLVGAIVDPDRKAELLETIAREEGAEPRQVVAVGDGANDRRMLRRAGFGVAFRAKPALLEVADATLGARGLDDLLYLMGLSEAEVETLLAE